MKHLTFRLQNWLYSLVMKYTLYHGITYSEFMRMAISSYLTKNNEFLDKKDVDVVTQKNAISKVLLND